MHELLAPVGSLEMLNAALYAGADAVYLSGPQYGARSEKATFTLDALKEVITRAHLYDVRVYITVNTLIKERECNACFDYLDYLVSIGVDAIIVQDLGVIRYLRSHYPTLEIHGSTQMAVYDINGVKMAAKLGLSRIVVARETPLKTIIAMLELDLIELEVFVHGALCYAYSGQCLLSSVNGGRSGNRGQCAQPCRMRYTLEEQDVYAMSMRDLSSIHHIDKIKIHSIASFKIEGRLRSADYVFHTIKAYKMALDGLVGNALKPYIDNMEASFNRSYTSGHLLNDNDRLTMNFATNKGTFVGVVLKGRSKYKLKLKLEHDICVGDALKFMTEGRTYGVEIFNIYLDGEKVKSAHANQRVEIDYNGHIPVHTKVYKTKSQNLTNIRIHEEKSKIIPIKMTFVVDKAYRVLLTIDDKKNQLDIVLETPAQIPLKRAITEEEIKKNLSKVGDTPFVVEDITCHLAQPIFMAKSDLNSLRRAAVDALIKKRTAFKKHLKQVPDSSKGNKEHCNKHANIVCYISTKAQLDALKDYNVEIYTDQHELLAYNNVKRAIRPFSVYDEEHKKSVMISNIGHIYLGNDMLYDLHSPVMNTGAFDELVDLGVEDITLSPELSQSESTTLLKKRSFRIFAYGKIPVMYSQTCAKKASGQKCHTCSRQFTVQNERTQALNVQCDGRVLKYYTDKPIVRSWAWCSSPATALFLYFTDEDKDSVKRVITAIQTENTLDIIGIPAFKKPIL